MNYKIEKLKELERVKKLAIIGFFVIAIIGTLLNFTY